MAVVRVSGHELAALVQRFCRPRGGWPPPRRARQATFHDGEGVFDTGLVTWFPAPASYTGEDVVELGCHGNPLLVERLLAAAVQAGARMAEPGEFTRRAWLNGRLDLTRAEAVLHTLEATSPAGLEVARAAAEGAVAREVEALRAALLEAAAELEARLDHPGEDLVLLDDAQLSARLVRLAEHADGLAGTWQRGRTLVEGATVALVGPVNAGKSSLFNALGGSHRALVSPEPGTTRDVVERSLVLHGVRLTLLDTAGERDDPGELEAQGLALGRERARAADLLVVVVPAHEPRMAAAVIASTEGRPRLLVANHADRAPLAELHGHRLIRTVASAGHGVPELSRAIVDALLGEAPAGAGVVIASQRQRDLFLEAARRSRAAAEALCGWQGVAVAAEEVVTALEGLDALDGRDTRDAVLDTLFARFCIGK